MVARVYREDNDSRSGSRKSRSPGPGELLAIFSVCVFEGERVVGRLSER